MAPWMLTQWCINLRRRPKPPPLSIVPICLAFVTSFLILLNMSFTFNNFFHFANISSNTPSYFPAVDSPFFVIHQKHDHQRKRNDDSEGDDSQVFFSDENGPPENFSSRHDDTNDKIISINAVDNRKDHMIVNNTNTVYQQQVSILPELTSPSKTGSSARKVEKVKYDEQVYHDKQVFFDNYKEMKTSLKVYIYPHNKSDPFAHALLPTDDHHEPAGNYASESYFKNVLYKSHFVTNQPSQADLFFLPFSIASLRHDPNIGVAGLADYVLNYINNVTHNYPYWNNSGGADHFYVACHSIGRIAMEKVEHVKSNAIQVICSSSYFLANYFAHKDVSLPQIWPRKQDLPHLASISKRKKLAFFAGAANSPLRKSLVQTWENDTSIYVHGDRLKTPYSEQLLGSKYCLHIRGFEVNTARVGDAIYYGCVPVILADYYDLPFMDILNWKTFSVVITTSDIPNLKSILQSISLKRYKVLQANVLKVRKHFQWNKSPQDFDTFYMVMYELWLRRSSIKILS